MVKTILFLCHFFATFGLCHHFWCVIHFHSHYSKNLRSNGVRRENVAAKILHHVGSHAREIKRMDHTHSSQMDHIHGFQFSLAGVSLLYNGRNCDAVRG